MSIDLLSFVSEDTYVIDLRPRGKRFRVYTVNNPTDVSSRDAFSYLVGQTVLINGVERVIYGVESFCLGGVYRAGRPIGLAVVEDETREVEV